ncbi:TauD/TfdA family dioxygenase [Catenulispora sp. NF23]|uniref:TauD/TfdA family dioxygenase n=1 Tax=Catenulispora pinistramenti TaxID=2705254 RepID=A0ABS5KJC7_9ACTN|nr:TauD/TfdA family dioxygenase [Catenulispora pinistramenti]MBS2533587.1 TauD/TfdA family dioxygenase [Catenulispora pinistramenti]MBS2546492.1 TauD/TfdA family dioxygenase [Catenulispora pinistramenti]
MTQIPAIWLRDNCHCPECVDPVSGQKLFGITDLPIAPEASGVDETPDHVTFTFAPDGHVATFPREWLVANHPSAPATTPNPRTEDAKTLWHGASHPIPRFAWDGFLTTDDIRTACLDAVLRQGYALLHGVPVQDRTVLRVASEFGYVRTTNYGEVFEVRTEPAATNLAFTNLPITPHTDNPYRDPVPTVQLLHCLVNAAEGGDSALVDGFEAAGRLRAADPAAFRSLTTTPVTFRYRDANTDLSSTQPLIGLDAKGRVREVRFNNRSMQPVSLEPDDIEAFYAAYRAFADLLYDATAAVQFRLGPGDCVIFDNTRVLHARTGFTADGRRHLQGCYIDLDGVASNHKVLTRAESAG